MRAIFFLLGIIRIPDLDLGTPAKINAAVASRVDHPPIEQKLKVAVIFVGREKDPLPVIDDHLILNPPVSMQILIVGKLLFVFRFRIEGSIFLGIFVTPPFPSAQIPSVEEGQKSLRLLLIGQCLPARAYAE